MEKAETHTIGTRVSTNFLEIIDEYISLDTHLNRAELIREALREKIDNDAPHLRRRMFEVGMTAREVAKKNDI